MTAKIFCKDLRLAAHPMMYVFALFGVMLLIPSYPYTVVFFYGLLGIFFTFLNGRENKDVYYCAVLPVTKREQVRARTWMVVAVELTELVLAVPFAVLSVRINPNGTNLAGIDANVALSSARCCSFLACSTRCSCRRFIRLPCASDVRSCWRSSR